MKKHLFLGLIMIFISATSLFAGLPDTKGDEKTPVKNNRENKLSDEEVSRLTRRAETENLAKNFTNNEAGKSKSNLVPAKQVVVEGGRHHGYFLYGGGTLLLIIILVLILA